MRYVLLIYGGKCNEGVPTRQLVTRLDRAIEFFRKHSEDHEVFFITTGRWPRIEREEPISEARVASQYIHDKLPGAVVHEETISVETIGNLAFSKPILEFASS